MHNKIKLGITLPHIGQDASKQGIVTYARESERMGFNSLWTVDHWLRPAQPVYNEMMGAEWSIPFELGFDSNWEALLTLTYVSTVTRSIKLGTSAICSPLYMPVDLARRLATADRYTEGRLIAGLGFGWMKEEFIAAGRPFEQRLDAFNEFLQILRSSWGPDPVPALDGKYFKLVESYIGPKPLQHPFPLLLSAVSPAGARRAGRNGLGFNPQLWTWAQCEQLTTQYRGAVREAGHDMDKLPIIIRHAPFFKVHAEPLNESDRPLLHGSMQQITADIARLRQHGISEVIFDYTQVNLSVEQQLEELNKLITALVAAGDCALAS